jgi:hypothetical protein
MPKGKILMGKTPKNKAIPETKQKGFGAKPGGKTPMQKPKGKTKPVMPRRGGK